MSILSGLFSPTSGTAYLNGIDIRHEPDEARKSLGLCPQNDVLFNDMTLKEHLIFFCCLKGMTDMEEISEQVINYVTSLDLLDSMDKMSANLSGGVKRKLSVGIALCGKSKICILDEPSSG
jgi:ATP-binding cassette, subfamily A (ABC1), member 3